MINKKVVNINDAISKIYNGSVILASGFGNAGAPNDLLEAITKTDINNLTIVSNNAGEGNYGLAKLLKSGKVTKIICSYPISSGSVIFQDLYNSGQIQLEVVPQGTLSERMRAAGAGIGAFFTPTSAQTKLGETKETRFIQGVEHVLEYPLKGDIALIGLAVMGQNLILNMNDKGFTVVAYNRTTSKVEDFINGEAKGTNFFNSS